MSETRKSRRVFQYSEDPKELARQVQELATDVDRLLEKLDADDNGNLLVEGEITFVS